MNFLGFENNRNTFKVLERSIHSKSSVMRRSNAESNSESLQIVICSIIKYKDQIALFTKQEFRGNRRFHNKNMIWVGGHLQKVDLDNLNNITVQKSMSNCVLREINEEIQLNFDIKPVYQGLIYDNTHPKSLIHLGVVFLLNIKEEKIMKTLNLKSFKELSGQIITVEFIPLIKEYFDDNIEELEPWSVDILKGIFNIDVSKARKSQQMVMF